MPATTSDNKRPLFLLAAAVAVLSLLFLTPLQHLWLLARSSDLYSHVILIPFVSIYLAWDTSRLKTIEPSAPNRLLSIWPLTAGAISLFAFFQSDANPLDPDQIENYLAYSIFAYVCFIISTLFQLFGAKTIRAQIFPILFLVLLTPFPAAVREGIQIFFQHTSAEAAYWGIKLIGVPIYREGLIFQMPTINMEVAPQCSGIRSSLVLFITSLVASFLFLKSPWKRAIFVSLFIPIGIIRNAIRITVLAWQCYYIDPAMIDGWFHKQGGQPLFAVTLIPVFIVLWLFRRSERKSEENNSHTR
ncbi:VPDSG-CTERM-specific exosortase XrtC [Pelagicoccus sp. SDUM812005]|uniref:VPDSG-CTERM-specific exosortase XrtC n=1 Tax=Pelagicoccus sp. SDUM812005 TaxID=3041257 RepID=UPI00280E1996|nr:VPDSG-CTERM-specific exosortase XrtC [Pelagicoccus sp. SDUM812005]MDQ8183722.1 VPDSG-CTERM-specific exosortase XrtC [Pelagicoccus sp. SDUM812005]